MKLSKNMFKKKKIITLALAFCLTFSLTACGGSADSTTKAEGTATEGKTSEGKTSEGKTSEGTSTAGTEAGGTEGTSSGKALKIVTTIFPEYDWVREILGENPAGAEVTMLLDNGADLHSYQPTAEDIMRISTCDVFIYVGGESDKWVDDALKEAVNPDMKVIDLMDVVGDAAKEEEVIEGMESDDHDHEDADHEDADHEDADHEDADHEDADHEDADHEDADHEDADYEDADHEDDDHEDEDHHHEGGEKEYDEHVWLSLKNAEKIVGAIAETLGTLDTANKAVYDSNAAAYRESLTKLDTEYKNAVDAGKTKTLLFGDRFPFRYMVDDYGLSYFAAFVGCSAETEASFETITFLSGKVDELGLKCVFKIDGSDGKIAETIVENTKTKDQKVLTLNSMQSITAQDMADGAKYLKIMEDNLSVLSEGLK